MQRVQWIDHDWSVARGLAFGVYRLESRTLVGHGGDCPGFNTRLLIDPVSRYGVVTMANRNKTDVFGYAAMIFDILEAGGMPEGDESESSATNVELDDFVGSYNLSPWDGEEMVFRWKDGLAMVTLPTMDPVKGIVRLKHIEGDRFHTIRSDEEAGHEVVFSRDESGRITHMIYHSKDLPRL
jgi:hypothetical protein